MQRALEYAKELEAKSMGKRPNTTYYFEVDNFESNFNDDDIYKITTCLSKAKARAVCTLFAIIKNRKEWMIEECCGKTKEETFRFAYGQPYLREFTERSVIVVEWTKPDNYRSSRYGNGIIELK